MHEYGENVYFIVIFYFTVNYGGRVKVVGSSVQHKKMTT